MPDGIHTALRALLFMAILFVLTKLLGKKQISQLSFFEYISGITIGSFAAEVVTGLERSIVNGTIAIVIFGAITYFVDWYSLRSKKFSDITEGKPTEFIRNGKILEDNLKREKFTIDEVLTFLRQKNVFNVADVEFAVMEPTGELSVLLKKEKQPVTPKDLGLPVAPEKESKLVIRDGKIIYDALSDAKKTPAWLQVELEKLNVTADNVFLGMVDSYGELTVDLYDDQLQSPITQERPLLMAQLKKCQADLESFALETQAQEAKSMYNKHANKLAEITELLTPYLRG